MLDFFRPGPFRPVALPLLGPLIFSIIAHWNEFVQPFASQLGEEQVVQANGAECKFRHG
jgi:hypothetical protein